MGDKLSKEIGKAKNKQKLDLSGRQLEEIPDKLGVCRKLVELNVSSNALSGLPPELGLLSNLEILHIENNRMNGLPVEVGKLPKLEELYAHHNRLFYCPITPELAKCTSLQRIDFSFNQLDTLPESFFDLGLVALDLSNNAFKGIDENFAKFTQLEELKLNDNKIKYVPAEIGGMARLQCKSVFHALVLLFCVCFFRGSRCAQNTTLCGKWPRVHPLANFSLWCRTASLRPLAGV